MKIKVSFILLLLAILYLIASFVAMDFNPKNWDSFGRGFIAIMAISIMYSIIVAENK